MRMSVCVAVFVPALITTGGCSSGPAGMEDMFSASDAVASVGLTQGAAAAAPANARSALANRVLAAIAIKRVTGRR
ncbi:MAG: hypothetical protein AAFO79_06945 [Pseudomonadota bacterium]